MSTPDLLEHLSKLDRTERQKVWQHLEDLEMADVEETPEILTAIDAGRAAVKDGKTHTVEGVRQLIGPWTTKSS